MLLNVVFYPSSEEKFVNSNIEYYFNLEFIQTQKINFQYNFGIYYITKTVEINAENI